MTIVWILIVTMYVDRTTTITHFHSGSPHTNEEACLEAREASDARLREQKIHFESACVPYELAEGGKLTEIPPRQ